MDRVQLIRGHAHRWKDGHPRFVAVLTDHDIAAAKVLEVGGKRAEGAEGTYGVIHPIRCVVTVHGAVRAPPPRNVVAIEPAITDPLMSATLWGGVGGGETRQIAMPRFPGP